VETFLGKEGFPLSKPHPFQEPFPRVCRFFSAYPWERFFVFWGVVFFDGDGRKDIKQMNGFAPCSHEFVGTGVPDGPKRTTYACTFRQREGKHRSFS
jgi:hypothetical protein